LLSAPCATPHEKEKKEKGHSLPLQPNLKKKRENETGGESSYDLPPLNCAGPCRRKKKEKKSEKREVHLATY